MFFICLIHIFTFTWLRSLILDERVTCKRIGRKLKDTEKVLIVIFVYQWIQFKWGWVRLIVNFLSWIVFDRCGFFLLRRVTGGAAANPSWDWVEGNSTLDRSPCWTFRTSIEQFIVLLNAEKYLKFSLFAKVDLKTFPICSCVYSSMTQSSYCTYIILLIWLSIFGQCLVLAVDSREICGWSSIEVSKHNVTFSCVYSQRPEWDRW